MFTSSQNGIVLLFIVITFLLLLLCFFIVGVIFLYQQKQNTHTQELEDVKATYQNTLLQSQLEIQEETLTHIATEIHDNIGQKLTLAKLYLNTLPYVNIDLLQKNVTDSLNLITDSIISLSNISRSMGTQLILDNGLIKALEIELNKLNKPGTYATKLTITGTEVFLNSNTELVIYRIVQECINNFVKHANGKTLTITLTYTAEQLLMQLQDDGTGFNTQQKTNGAGLHNIRKRAMLLHGNCEILSNTKSTNINIQIPINDNTKQT